MTKKTSKTKTAQPAAKKFSKFAAMKEAAAKRAAEAAEAEKPAGAPKAKNAAKPTAEAKGPREGSKKALVLAAVESKKGASRADLAKATGWSESFVHGFLNWTVAKYLESTGRALAKEKNKETGDWTYRVA